MTINPNVSAGPRVGAWVLRVLIVAGLAVDAYVHLALAGQYDSIPATIGQGTLFRVEGAAAVVAAVAVLVPRLRVALVVAFLVAAGGVVAVVLYRYVDFGAVGPFPDMYEPVWYLEKSLSAVAEAVAAVAALLLLAGGRSRR